MVKLMQESTKSEAIELEILIIRHGQSEADILEVHEGRADFPLTEVGEEQARRMADFVAKEYPPEMILSSTLKRASGTAGILQEAIGCELRFYDELREFNNGVLAGMPRTEAAIKYPLPKGGRPVHIPIQDGESVLDIRYRAERILREILHDYQDYKRIAIVSHGKLISNLLKAFLHQPHGDIAFATGDTGIHLLEVREDLRLVRFLNRLEHVTHE
ncbi:histidine phosphatase family protein [Sporosarcina thermotolerans]|uniref:Histidine phosphatase family protein n=1 Tax=Sporosarcina thermotolerans TaxID=633404 RepID=A0AAW9ADI1_9BACL|nr:histidine phosphatase family protein [Sporosarcina thermotolerans]MDW0117206.1 histidine phosphatase family protein [Sporosarcina thermotolerans]WHT47377.1 histidine phosphatase family protein [Sporosarcina thermotolerans]